MAKLTKQHDLMALYAVMPIYRCVHCNHEDYGVCSPRAWRQAEKCSYFKKAEGDFYRRNAGGPVACYPSLTRGRGIVSGSVGDLDAHVAARRSWITAQEIDAWMATFDDYDDENVRSSSS